MKDNSFVIKFDGVNCERGADKMILFTPERGATTKTNPYGFEAVVKNGEVVKKGSNDNEIPAGGFVLSGHGTMSRLITAKIPVGARVELSVDGKSATVTVGKETELKRAEIEIDEVKLHVNKSPETKKEASVYIEKAAAAFEEAKKADDEEQFKSYLRTVTENCNMAYIVGTSSPTVEARGIWHRPSREKSAADVDATVKRLADAGFNMVLVETFYNGYVIYKNSAYCKTRPNIADLDFDMLEEFIKAGKKYDVEIHAWVEDFFVGGPNENTFGTISGSPILDEHPEWAARLKDGSIHMTTEPKFVYVNAAMNEVQDFISNVYAELVSRYDIDGIQLDYIRYPLGTTIDNTVGFDDFTLAEFKKLSGIDARDIADVNSPEWREFTKYKASHITRFVKRIHSEIREFEKKSGRRIYISTAVIGHADDAMRTKCQDWPLWLSEGWLDFISPMAYYEDNSEVEREVASMVNRFPEIPNYAGIAPMFNHMPPIDSTRQIVASRNAKAKGVVFFATDSLDETQAKLLKIGAFKNKAKIR